MVELNQSIEEQIRERALSYLEHGRMGWDIPHTLACVHWMKELLKHELGDEKILVTTMYLHDIGIVPFDSKHTGVEEQLKKKKLHMELSAKNAESILQSMTYFTDDEKKLIIHLVSIHDDLSKINTSDAQLVFEADCLGQIDRERVKSTMSDDESKKFLNYFKKERLPLFKTQFGVRFAEKLLADAFKRILV